MAIRIVFPILGILAAGAPAFASDASWACREAATETIKPDAPDQFRATVISACERALRSTQDNRCDVEAEKADSDMRVAVSYTCAMASSLM